VLKVKSEEQQDIEYVMQNWQYPPKQASDIAWIYVSIHSDSECEAVTVIACQEQEIV
jgi:hypothetical protein